MDRQVLLQAVKTLLLGVKSATPERATELLQDLPGRDGFVPRLTRWLEENKFSFPELISAENLDSIYDHGIDVLLIGSLSGTRIGFQVKSDNDLRSKYFTRELKAQILESQRMGVELVIIVFACAPTKQNLPKIKYWQVYASDHPRPEIRCLPPEATAGLYEIFDLPIEPITPARKSWVDFFQTIGKLSAKSFYLDTWPSLLPDQRFLPPEVFSSIRQSLQENRLTFLVGSPAAGKTFTALQLLWEAFLQHRPVHWLSVTDNEPTEGPVPKAELGLVEKMELRRRVDALLRSLDSPKDEIDVVSRVLVPDALVYIEDPFGKSEDEYSLALASYSFFDLQHLVEELEGRSVRAGCRLIVTSREDLFQRWLSDLKAAGREATQCQVIRLTHDDYYPGDLFRHAVLLAGAKGLANSETIAEILVDHVESPFELDILIRLLPLHSGVAEAEAIVADWKGGLRTKIGGRITPRNDSDAVVLLLIAASDLRHEKLHFPSEMYSNLHTILALEGEPKAIFDAALQRLSPFLCAQNEDGVESLPFAPSHTVIRDAIREQLASPQLRPLLCQVARALSQIPPRLHPEPSEDFFDLSNLIDPWADHSLVALYLLSLGVALEGEEESTALATLLFDLIRVGRSEYRRVMEYWHLLPTRFRERILAGLRKAPEEDKWGLWNSAAALPYIQIDPGDAWTILELLMEEPRRGSVKTIYEESPWTYLFLHLEEIPQSLREKLDAWAREDPALFVYAMDEKLLQHWDQLPDLWRGCLFHRRCLQRSLVVERLVRTTSQSWNKAPQPFREIFDFLAKSPKSDIRALVGSQALFYAERFPDLERYALEASRDPEPMVRLKTLRWGRGNELHRRAAEALLAEATPGVAAEAMLDLLEEDAREEIAAWEKEIIARCKHLGGDAAKAAIACAIIDGKERVRQLGYTLAESPFEEPEIVRAVWLLKHLDSQRTKPPLSNQDLQELLSGLTTIRIRAWCLAAASYHLKALPVVVQQFLAGLSESSEQDAKAIQAGAQLRESKRSFPFSIRSLTGEPR